MQTKGSRDFEFLYGQWLVRNRRLRRPLAGSADWDEFDSVQTCRPLLDGLGNVDEFLCEDCGPLAATLRFFSPQSRRWTLHRVSSRDGVLQPKLEGAFRGGIGEFYGEHSFAGRQVLVRNVWMKTDTAAPRWERAFSLDGGNTWEINWTMTLARLDWPFESGVPDRADGGSGGRQAPPPISRSTSSTGVWRTSLPCTR